MLFGSSEYPLVSLAVVVSFVGGAVVSALQQYFLEMTPRFDQSSFLTARSSLRNVGARWHRHAKKFGELSNGCMGIDA
jgi:hypothetical protein